MRNNRYSKDIQDLKASKRVSDQRIEKLELCCVFGEVHELKKVITSKCIERCSDWLRNISL